MKFPIVLAAALALAACVPIEGSEPLEKGIPTGLSGKQAKTVQAGVRAGMKDPDSARFGSMAAAKSSKGVITACGYVNGRNSFGGYTGEQPYIGVFSDDGAQFQLVNIGGHSRQICQMAGANI